MNYIQAEDLEWYDDLYQENFVKEKCNVIDSFCGTIKDAQNCQFVNTHPLNQETTESINSIDSTEEKCYTPLGENKLKFSDKSSFEEVKCFITNHSDSALNCLYRNNGQYVDLDNVVKHEAEGNHNSKEESLGNNSNPSTSNNLEACMANSFHDNTPLNAETISLIRNSIIGEYDPPESISSINYSPNENEQVVPISNNVSIGGNENHKVPFNFPNQDNAIFNDENTLSSNDTRHSTDIIEGVNYVSTTNEASPDGELLGIQSTFFGDISVFTPGGQCYKLPKRSELCSKTEVATDQKQLNAAALLNNCKKIRQIQSGIFIPESLDFNKEEDFNKWFREEKFKIKSLFEDFNININMKYLKVERELMKLDRSLKQCALSCVLDSQEILELVDKTDVDLTNLLFTHQVYETVSKVVKNCKGPLRVKARKVLIKLKSLLSPPKGIRMEKYLNDLLLKNNVCKPKPEVPVEWIIHLLTYL